MAVGNFGEATYNLDVELGSTGYKSYVDTRLLELRSGIFFEYPVPKDDSQNILFFLPFFENPQIREDNSARLAEYNIINRNGSLYAHVGSKSRRLSLDFNLTLPHLYDSFNSVATIMKNIGEWGRATTGAEKDKFKHLLNKDPFDSELSKGAFPAEETYNQWKRVWTEINSGNLYALDPFVESPEFLGQGPHVGSDYYPYYEENRRSHLDLSNDRLEKHATMLSASRKRTISSVVYMLDIIRSCVGNNATSTSLGPPLLRVRHGAMYRDVPCIAKSFKIEIVQDAGYDLKTLLPHRIRIMLDLVEVRTGTFGDFRPGVKTERDNVVGWESVLRGDHYDPGEIDPQKADLDPKYGNQGGTTPSAKQRNNPRN